MQKGNGDRVVQKNDSPVGVLAIHVGVDHVAGLGRQDANMMTRSKEFLFNLSNRQYHSVVHSERKDMIVS